ncbi:hypothetical protein I3W98_36340 [Streptomyces cavourensis]|nr:hypothetical protein [Streptomyces cavourensis]
MTVVTSAALLAGLLSAEALAVTRLALPSLQKIRPVPVTEVESRAGDASLGNRPAPDVTWPSPGTAEATFAGRANASG